MTYPRWCICSTGADEEGGEPTHVIFEINPKTNVYSPVLQTFTLAYAHLILEALCWQEDLQRGLAVDPKPNTKQPPKATPKKAVEKTTSKRKTN